LSHTAVGYPILQFDGSWRAFGLVVDNEGYFYILYNNSSYSTASTNTFTSGTNYDIKVQYVNGAARLLVNNVLEINTTLPALDSESSSNNILHLGDNPGAGYAVEACYSNLKVYSEPNSLSTSRNEILADLKLYPNPTEDTITVDIPAGLKVSNIKLYDLTGRIVKDVTYTNSESNKVQINLQELTQGTYMARIVARNGLMSHKMVVKK